MKELKKSLRSIKRKLFLEAFFKRLFLHSSIALAVIFFVLLLSKVKYIYHVNLLCVFIFLFFVFSCVLLSAFFDRPNDEQAARAGDSLGYEERFVTALELLKQDNQQTMSKLAIKDALQKAQGNDLGKQYHLKMPIRLLKISSILLVGIFLTGFFSAPQKEDIETLIDPQLTQIQQIKKETNKEKKVEKEQLKEFNQKISAFTKAIQKSMTKSEAVKEIQNTQQELKKLEKKNNFDDLKKIGEALSQNEQTKELSKALQDGNAEKIAEALAQLQKQMEQKSEKELSELSDFIKKAAQGLTSEQLAQAVNQFAQQLQSGDIQTGNLSNEFIQFVQKNEALKNAIEQTNQALAQASQSLQQTQSNNQENQSGTGNGNREGQGQKKGNGNGEGQGQGKGKESGNGTGGNGRGTGHVETENIYTRQAEEKAGYDTQIKGTQNEGGQTMQSKQKTFGSAGESMPYESVYQEYKNQALKDIENETIPYGMRQLVAEYFSTLEK